MESSMLICGGLQECLETLFLALIAATSPVSSQIRISLGFVRSLRIPRAKQLGELFVLLLPLFLLVVACPALLYNGSIIVGCASVVVDSILLRVGSSGLGSCRGVRGT
jgi:hypothetical protein